jgi:hypothetical protein
MNFISVIDIRDLRRNAPPRDDHQGCKDEAGTSGREVPGTTLLELSNNNSTSPQLNFDRFALKVNGAWKLFKILSKCSMLLTDSFPA